MGGGGGFTTPQGMVEDDKRVVVYVCVRSVVTSLDVLIMNSKGGVRMGVFTSSEGLVAGTIGEGGALRSLSPALAMSSLMSLESFHSPYLCGKKINC